MAGHRANAQNSPVRNCQIGKSGRLLPKGLTPSHDGRPSASRRWATEAFPRSWKLSRISSDVSRTSPTVFRPAAANTLRIRAGNSTSLIGVSSGSSGVGSSIFGSLDILDRAGSVADAASARKPPPVRAWRGGALPAGAYWLSSTSVFNCETSMPAPAPLLRLFSGLRAIAGLAPAKKQTIEICPDCCAPKEQPCRLRLLLLPALPARRRQILRGGQWWTQFEFEPPN